MNNTITIPTAQFQAIASFRAVGDIRYYLNGVLLETGPQGAFIVATDGFAMAAARIDREPMADSRIILPLGIIEQIEKLKLKKNPAFIIELPEQKFKGTLKTLDYEMQFNGVDAKYPNWRSVARHTFDGTAVAYDPKYLSKVDNAAGLIKGCKQDDPVTPLRPGVRGTCGFAWLDKDGEACAWVAAMNYSLEQLPGAPVWTV